MTELSPAEVAASVARALWGEVSDHLRSVQFRIVGNQIELRFVFDRNPDDDELDSMGFVGVEVAADFASAHVNEEALAITEAAKIPCDAGWHMAYARKGATLAH